CKRLLFWVLSVGSPLEAGVGGLLRQSGVLREHPLALTQRGRNPVDLVCRKRGQGGDRGSSALCQRLCTQRFVNSYQRKVDFGIERILCQRVKERCPCLAEVLAPKVNASQMDA